MLEMKGVCKQVGADQHITHVDLSLQPGTVNVLLGPTLSGKTTLMRLMAGLDRPTRGEITHNGHSVVGVPVRARNVAMVYQQFINYPALTVFENIASPLRIAGADRATIDREVHKAAELLKLVDYLERTPLSLSGGQQQRTAIARALVKGAELVLLDEPLANLDYKLREELRNELPRLFAETGAIFVYATTEPQEALLLGGHTATLSEGRVTQFGPTIDVFQRPHDLPTARTFADPPLNTAQVALVDGEIRLGQQSLGRLGSAPDAHGSASGGPSGGPSGGASGLPDGCYTLAIRAHHLSLSPRGASPVAMQATVQSSEITGSETFLHMQVDTGQQAESERWVLLTQGVHPLANGAQVPVYIDTDSLYLFDAQGHRAHAPRRLAEAA